MVSLMFRANVETLSALDAGLSLIDLVIAKLQPTGKLKTQLKARISLGSWPTQSNAPTAENLLKRIKVVTI